MAELRNRVRQRWKELKKLYFSKKFSVYHTILHIIFKLLCAGHQETCCKECPALTQFLHLHLLTGLALTNGTREEVAAIEEVQISAEQHISSSTDRGKQCKLCRLDSHKPGLRKEIFVRLKERYILGNIN